MEGLAFGERTVLCLPCELQFDRSDLNSVQAGGQSAWFCPECGRRCQTAQDWLAAQNPAGEKGFAVCVWEAFGYPLNPNGAIFLVGGALFFSIIHFMGMAAPAAGMIGLLLIVLLGVGEHWLFVFVFEERCRCVLGRGGGLAGRAGCFGAVVAVGCLAGAVFGAGLVTFWTAGSEAGWAVLLGARWAGMQLGDYLPSLIGILVTELTSLYFLIEMMRVLGCMSLRQSGKTALAWIGQDGFAQEARAKNPMGKGEIAWKGEFEDGRRRQVYAKCVRKVWRFFEREKRFDPWRPLKRPSLKDWRMLLDGLERRAQRRTMSAAEVQRIQRRIKELFPELDDD